MLDETERKQIASTILAQLGGNKFKVMTGAKSLSTVKNGGLSFKIGRNKTSCNYVKIILNSLDLYEIEFIRIRAGKITVMEKFSDVYCSELAKVFTGYTGLYTKLF